MKKIKQVIPYPITRNCFCEIKLLNGKRVKINMMHISHVDMGFAKKDKTVVIYTMINEDRKDYVFEILEDDFNDIKSLFVDFEVELKG